MQVLGLRSATLRCSSECSLGIKAHACDPNMPHLLAVAVMNNQWVWEVISKIRALCFIRGSKNLEIIKAVYYSLELQKDIYVYILRFGHEYVMMHPDC